MELQLVLAIVLGVVLLGLLVSGFFLISTLRRLGALRADLAAAKAEAERLPAAEAELTALRDQLRESENARLALDAELTVLKKEHEARLEELHRMKEEIEDRFKALASDALSRNSKTFLELVSERFEKHAKTAGEDLSRRQEAISNLVKPLNEKLQRFDEEIKALEKQRAEAHGAIVEKIGELTQSKAALEAETRKLVQALRTPKTRGRWGEMQLRQVFELAGMAEHVDFLLERHVATDDGARRPDAVVHIPGGKNIVIDAKTPLEAYLDAMEADTPETAREHMKRHARHVRDHVQLLASKAYQSALKDTPDFDSPDFVVMFIPGETFVSAAAEADPHLIEYAFEKKVLIATPTTLMALVKAIAYGWQQEKMAENAQEVQRLARDLYERLGKFAVHLDDVGKNLERSTAAYNKAVGSLEGRVLVTARKFESLGVVPASAELPSPRTAETETRPISAPEAKGETDD